MLTLPLYRSKIRPHEAYSGDKLQKIFEVARKHSPKIHALISLLKTCALRIQDAIGLTFGTITQQTADEKGYIKLHLAAKKTTARTVTVDSETIAIVKVYQNRFRYSDSDIMFPPGEGQDPANKWTNLIRKFFKRHGLTV